MREDRNKKEDSGLRLPNFESKQELINWLNNEAREYRPKGKVVHILTSRVFDKDQLCTIKIGKPIRKQLDEEYVKRLQEDKEECKNFIREYDIRLIPLSKT